MKKLLYVIIVAFITLQLCFSVNAIEVTCSFTATGGDPGDVAMQYPQPTNESWNEIDNHTLQVLVYNDLGEVMNVSFYWSNGTLIGTDTNVINNTNASVEHPTNYTHYQTYYWYVTVNSSSYNNMNATWWFKGEAYNWDINRNADINIVDVTGVTSHYGESGSPGWIRADANNNGDINIIDVTSVTAHYGESY